MTLNFFIYVGVYDEAHKKYWVPNAILVHLSPPKLVITCHAVLTHYPFIYHLILPDFSPSIHAHGIWNFVSCVVNTCMFSKHNSAAYNAFFFVIWRSSATLGFLSLDLWH
ncbi:hypothetical protein ACJX0J_034565 [Zea mays]